jgi:hypothetical protein
MNEIIVLIHSILIGFFLHQMLKPNELLMYYAKYINIELNPNFYVKKLLVCPYCIAGQICMWSHVFLISEYIIVNTLLTILIVKHYADNFR